MNRLAQQMGAHAVAQIQTATAVAAAALPKLHSAAGAAEIWCTVLSSK
jgi:hypothetical protein